MKSRMYTLVKRLWPLAAFVVAACLVAGFVNAQHKAAQENSPEEIRRKRYSELLDQASRCARDRSYDKALDALEQIIAEYPGAYNPAFDVDAAELCLKATPPQVDRAASHIETFLRSSSDSRAGANVLKVQGELAFAKQEDKEALEYFQEYNAGLENGKNDYHVLGLMARCHHAIGDDVEAEKWWRKVADESVDYREPYEARLHLGEISAARFLGKLNDPKYAAAALEEFKRVVNGTLDSDLCYAAYVGAAEVLSALGEYDKAREMYLSALDVAPPLEEMTRFLEAPEAAERDEVLYAQIFGAPQMTASDGSLALATKLQKIARYYRENGRLLDAISMLDSASTGLENKQAIYLQIAALYDLLVLNLKDEIKTLDAKLLELKSGLSDRLRAEAAFRLEAELKSRNELLGNYLKSAADYYERGFNEDPHQGSGADYREHPLWKAAQRLLENQNHTSAERILLRLLGPQLRLENKVMTAAVHLTLGRMCRDGGRHDEALAMFRAVIQDRPNPNDVGNGDFLGWAAFEEAITLAMMRDDAAAEKAFENILSDDNSVIVGRASEIWRRSTFELGKLRYREAMSAGADRVEKLEGVVDFLTEALDRYEAFLKYDPDTRNLLLYYAGDSLHHLALEAISRGENQKARELFQRARQYLDKMTASGGPPENMPVFYRNSRLLVAQTLDFESRITPDAAQKQALVKAAMGKYEDVSKTLEGTEQGFWALIQLGVIADASADNAVKATAKRYYDLAEAGINKLKESGAFKNNPRGFDAAYVREILDWLRGRSN